MAENYSLNSGFGYNISHKGPMAPNEKKSFKLDVKMGGLFDSVNNFFEKHEKVFTGDVQNEINMYTRQMMIVGMNLKASDKTIRRFDMNI